MSIRVNVRVCSVYISSPLSKVCSNTKKEQTNHSERAVLLKTSLGREFQNKDQRDPITHIPKDTLHSDSSVY